MKRRSFTIYLINVTINLKYTSDSLHCLVILSSVVVVVVMLAVVVSFLLIVDVELVLVKSEVLEKVVIVIFVAGAVVLGFASVAPVA